MIARAGYRVHGVDVDEKLVAALKASRVDFHEDDVNALIASVLQDGTLTVSQDIMPADIFIICVPTPISRDKTANLDMVRAASQSVLPYLKDGDLVILESTSPIGTTQNVIGGIFSQREVQIDLCYCPERVFPGDTIREILENDRVIGGVTPHAAQRAKAFYASFCKGDPILTTAASAEFSKLMENTYRDVNIALANVFARISEHVGVDVLEVIALANMHPRVNVHLPGPGVGGHCIPVDPWFLIEAFPSETQLFKTCRDINDTQASRLIDRAEHAGLRRGQKVAILGAAYRGNINDARDSPTELLIAELARKGYIWMTHDPLVDKFTPKCGNSANLCHDLDKVLDGADAVFLMTRHSVYGDLKVGDFKSLLPSAIIVDGPRALNPALLDALPHKTVITGK